MDEAAHIQYLKSVGFRDPLFKPQNSFVQDSAKFVAAQCSRRAGKSNGLGIRFLNAMERHPKALCRYIALTRESAQNIMWPVMEELDEKFKAGLHFTESNLTITHPNGARLKMFGADMKNFIKRLRGVKSAADAIDEAQDFGPHLAELIDDVITPALTDYEDSWLAITGTPGPVPKGYFHEITEGRKYGFSLHKWTLFENPYLPRAQSFVADLRKRREWPEDHPTLQREWFNRWILDVESLLIRYSAERDHYSHLPSPDAWTYIMGIDIGFKDADAIAILAWNEDSPTTYLIHESIAHKQGLTELVAEINKLRELYNIAKIVIDEGGLGKKLAEEIRRRHHIPVQAADKARKFETCEFLNDSLRLGHFKAKSASRFAEDSYRLQIDWEKSTPSRLVVKEGFHSDIIDAVIYAYKESPAFTYQKPIPKPAYGSPEWAKQEVTDMERAAEEHFRALEEAETGFGLFKDHD